MSTFKLTSAAVEDLKEIARYTQKKWGESKRNLYLTSINSKFIWLAENPNIGKIRDDIKKGYLSYPEGKHTIFYRLNKNHIEILATLHQSMDVKLHL